MWICFVREDSKEIVFQITLVSGERRGLYKFIFYFAFKLKQKQSYCLDASSLNHIKKIDSIFIVSSVLAFVLQREVCLYAPSHRGCNRSFCSYEDSKDPLRNFVFALVSCIWAQFVRTLRQYLH